MEKLAVQSGVFPLFKYNPSLSENKFKMITKKINPEKVREYIKMQSRFSSAIANKYANPKNEEEKLLKEQAVNNVISLQKELEDEIVKKFDLLQSFANALN